MNVRKIMIILGTIAISAVVLMAAVFVWFESEARKEYNRLKMKPAADRRHARKDDIEKKIDDLLDQLPRKTDIDPEPPINNEDDVTKE